MEMIVGLIGTEGDGLAGGERGLLQTVRCFERVAEIEVRVR